MFKTKTLYSFNSFSLKYPISSITLKRFLSAPAEPFEKRRNQISSLSVSLSNPSEILFDIEIVALLN